MQQHGPNYLDNIAGSHTDILRQILRALLWSQEYTLYYFFIALKLIFLYL